ncbi:Helix-turn-helix domain-containing protein [Jatrophihabitans endophyticus]|uniref:Helix-turn-helix domain-containing protein n=1 Tax=Jatrophihabitans endophyticus TaxID=1206085 RepID=A0A1M5C495_9ACTN|nr:helix-turn-helix transcriptional regulator [Jatrophihabitans endophyticus]SHF49558.1 Helix-turn-helix domain-containing protein [Jatrophihabitans endophyticus]
MVRPILSPAERARGRRLGAALRQARGERSMVDVAIAAGVPVETLRKIETGRIPTPAFFTVAALGGVLGLDLATLAAHVEPDVRSGPDLVAPDTATA